MHKINKGKIFFVLLGLIFMGVAVFFIRYYFMQRVRLDKENKGKESVNYSLSRKQVEEGIVDKFDDDEDISIVNLSDIEGQSKNREIDELIDKLVDEDVYVFQPAADRLAQLGQEAVPILLDKLKAAPLGLKGQIVFLLGRIKDKRAIPGLVVTLNDSNAYIRRNTVEALGKIGDKSSIGSLTPLLYDEDISVRERTVQALSNFRDKSITEDLLNRMIDEGEERVKMAVVKSLGELKDTRAVTLLLGELKAQSDQLYRNEVVYSLGEAADSAALAPLTNYLDELKRAEPTEPILIFQWQEAVRIAEEAINKINSN